jgi:hypothetical protein
MARRARDGVPPDQVDWTIVDMKKDWKRIFAFE